jgi:transcription antitermination factor NusG
MGKEWYCVNTNARSEDIAVRHLTRLGFVVLFPQFKKHKRLYPLFPSHIFLHFDAEQMEWRRIRSTTGVKNLYMLAPGKPYIIPREFIERIEDPHFLDYDDSVQMELLQEGDNVRIIDPENPLHMMQGIVNKSATERYEILVSIFGRYCNVEIDAAKLEKV